MSHKQQIGVTNYDITQFLGFGFRLQCLCPYIEVTSYVYELRTYI